MNRHGLALLTIAAVTVAVAPAAGSESVRVTDVVCGATLTTSTVLAGGLDCTGTGATAITMGAPNIKLDLGGHLLTVDAGQIGVLSSFSGDTVTHGSISGGSDAVKIQNTFGDTVSNLKLQNDGIDLENAGAVTVSSNTLAWDGGSGGTEITSEYGSKNVITGNTLSEGTITLAHESKDTIGKNSVTTDPSTGFDNYSDTSSNGNVFTGNRSSGGGNGFVVSEGENGVVTLTGNVDSGAGDDGFLLSQNYAVSSPTLHSTYSGNKASNDGQANFVSASDLNSTWSGNTATGSLYGFELEHPQGYVITRNGASDDNNAAFYLDSDAAIEQPATFASNQASASHHGFQSQYFLVLGTGNKVSGNTIDCTNTSCPRGGTTS